MNFVDIIYALASLACGTAAVLAWLAKVKWSKEFAAAKDATISAKDAVIQSKDAQIESVNAQVDSLRELTPMKIREYFLSMKEQLEEYIKELKKQLEHARVEIISKDQKIEELSRQGEKRPDMIIQLQEERDEIMTMINNLEKLVVKLQEEYKYDAIVSTHRLSRELDAFIANSGGVLRLDVDRFYEAAKKSSANLAAIPNAFEMLKKLGTSRDRVMGQEKKEAQSAKPEPEKKEKKE